MYLWLFLTIDIIKRPPRSKYENFLGIESLLSSLPTEISQAYETILNRSSDRDKAQKLLQIIFAASRPITLIDSNIALTMALQEPICPSHDALDLWPQERFGSLVENMCGLLITIHDGKLSLLHQTVRDFLTSASSEEALHSKD